MRHLGLEIAGIHLLIHVHLTSSSSKACLFFLLAWSCLFSSSSISSLRSSAVLCSRSSSSSSSSCSRVCGQSGKKKKQKAYFVLHLGAELYLAYLVLLQSRYVPISLTQRPLVYGAKHMHICKNTDLANTHKPLYSPALLCCAG